MPLAMPRPPMLLSLRYTSVVSLFGLLSVLKSGRHYLREMSNDERCDFVLWNGTKRMLKKDKLKAYLEAAYSI